MSNGSALFCVQTALFIVTMLLWHFPARRVDEEAPLARSEVGYLRRGRRRAVWAAIGTLVDRGALRVTRRTVARAGELPAGAPTLECAVHDRASPAVPGSVLMRDPKVRRALREMRASLVARGLLRPRWRRDLGFAAVVCYLTILGALMVEPRTAGGWAVVGALLCGAVIVMASVWSFFDCSEAGRRMVCTMRRQYPKPRRRSAGEAGEDGDVGMRVALYGIRRQQV